MTEAQKPATPPTSVIPDALTTVLLGHNAFQFMRAGVELGLFDLLERSPGASRRQLLDELGLQERALDILVLGASSLKLVEHTPEGFVNARSVSDLFAGGHWELVKAVVGFEAYVTYPGLVDFTESLRDNTNVGLRRYPGDGATVYHRLSQDPELLRIFYHFMGTWSAVASRHLIDYGDFSASRRILDVGGGDATMAIAVAAAHPEVEVTVLEIPKVVDLARKRVEEAGLSDRVKVVEGDIFEDAYPEGHDTVMFVHQLQIWPQDRIRVLLGRAHAVLPVGGRVMILNSMSEDGYGGPLMAALASPFFAAVAGEGGMLYSWEKYEESLKEVGFDSVLRTRCTDAVTPHGIVTATK
ncbi:methyltransferase [Streptomyces sp. NPDC060194]|uniref:methyltransferase n=1 Tax=Streptomyces sp. NPDC060194 TaxID=3347069 RepID=UPI0036602825